MSFGAKIKNNDQDILIDSDFGHYHFLGKASYVSTTRVPNILGGDLTQHSYDAGQHMANSQVNGDIIKYEISCDDGFVPPMCFIKPSTVSNTAPPCSIVLTKLIFGYFYKWEIWVLQARTGTNSSSTTYTRPTLYCFHPMDLWGSPRANLAVGDEETGVRMYNSSEVVTFDTRLKPLKVIKNLETTAPALAKSGTISSGNHPNFTPNNTTGYSHGLSNASDLMYYAPSLAHCCQETRTTRDGEGFQSEGYGSFNYAWARGDLWWCFYRNTFRLTPTQLQSTYSIYASGHVWTSVEEQSSGLVELLVGVILTIATGNPMFLAVGVVVTAINFESADIGSGDYLPYNNGSRNANETVPVIFSRPSYYD